MSESLISMESAKAAEESTPRTTMPGDKAKWETPRMEEVTEQVMAQPYIRFT